MSKQTIILDSTQIDAFLTCPRLWYYGHKLRLTPQVLQPRDAMMMGTYGHKLLEIYYKSRNWEKAMAFDPDNETCKCGHPISSHETIMHSSESTAPCGCNNPSPQLFPLDSSFRRQVVQHLNIYKVNWDIKGEFLIHDPNKVEVGFSEHLYEDSERLYILEGRIDLLDVDWKGQKIGFVDHKFQERKKNLYNRAIQFRNYAMVTEASLGVINYIRLAKSMSDDTFVRQLIPFTSFEHQVWRKRLINIFHKVSAAMIQSEKDLEYWMKEDSNPNWSSCSGRFGYECDFTQLCEELYPQTLQQKKNTLYTIRQEWKPW